MYEATQHLAERGVGGPYALVCSKEIIAKIKTSPSAYPLEKRIAGIVERTIVSPQYETNFVASIRGGDCEITVGQDFSVGYQSHTNTEVNFYITETFTFRIFEPNAFVPLRFAG